MIIDRNKKGSLQKMENLFNTDLSQKYLTADIVCSGSNSCSGENSFFRDVTLFSTLINHLIFLKIFFIWENICYNVNRM